MSKVNPHFGQRIIVFEVNPGHSASFIHFTSLLPGHEILLTALKAVFFGTVIYFSTAVIGFETRGSVA